MILELDDELIRYVVYVFMYSQPCFTTKRHSLTLFSSICRRFHDITFGMHISFEFVPVAPDEFVKTFLPMILAATRHEFDKYASFIFTNLFAKLGNIITDNNFTMFQKTDRVLDKMHYWALIAINKSSLETTEFLKRLDFLENVTHHMNNSSFRYSAYYWPKKTIPSVRIRIQAVRSFAYLNGPDFICDSKLIRDMNQRALSSNAV